MIDYVSTQRLRKQAAEALNDTTRYLIALQNNVKARNKVEVQDLPVANLGTGAALIGAHVPGIKRLMNSPEFHYNPIQHFLGVPWNDDRFLNMMTQRNHWWNPYELNDPRYPIAEKYIDDRAQENRENFKNRSLKDNPDTRVEFPKELDDGKGRQLKEWGYGFASNNKNLVGATT